MSEAVARLQPPDQRERERALDTGRSVLVQAPAGSGKTDLLARLYLRLLGEVNAPGEIVAITFTNAAAAEMRHRILGELERAATGHHLAEPPADTDEDGYSMPALARRALAHSRTAGWDLLEAPAQLRISTIDSFCRDLALQQPLLSALGGGITIGEQRRDLYRRAARRTLEAIDSSDAALRAALESLLLRRDNNWEDLEDLLVTMLEQRDRWMHDFVLDHEQDWEALRERLERPFANALRGGLKAIDLLLDRVPGAREEALALARFACEQSDGKLHRDLAEMADFPRGPHLSSAGAEEARLAYLCLADLLLTGRSFRQSVNRRHGFPADRKHEKNRILALIADLAGVPGLEAGLAAVRDLPPARYSDDEWQIVRACFTMLRHAAGELQVVFAEEGVADFTEVAQISLGVLQSEDGQPSDAAIALADGIRHLLVDEFQDTSRRQHELLRRLVAAWPEREGRTCFVVGDPMQSIYFFRDADAELFPRVRDLGLEIADSEPLRFDFVALQANFRTAPGLVDQTNRLFQPIFAAPDGGGIAFSAAQAAREDAGRTDRRFALHLEFVLQPSRGENAEGTASIGTETAAHLPLAELIDLIRDHLPRVEQARQASQRGEDAKYRIAVLGRTRNVLAPVAQALHEAAIPFRAVDLEKLADRPEIVDALSLARALLNPEDRVAWLGVLRAPWCGLALDDLHRLVSDDSESLREQPVPDLLADRLSFLSAEGRSAAQRVLRATTSARDLRKTLPNASLGTWLEQVWLRLGGADCVDSTARANLDLLWSCLDKLPHGEQDLLGPALSSALEKLTAQPDPAASSGCGVQLMTIHKAKGLEFEVVIVPGLEARCGKPARSLLSWLERGVAPGEGAGPAGDADEITEFLIAPVQSKGADRGSAKRWVDEVRRRREAQEERRILYVAATRAREELHLFARPAYKIGEDGEPMLCEPANSLLATAWPALEGQVRAHFDEWKEEQQARKAEPSELESIAAVAEDNALSMQLSLPSTVIRRLPPDYAIAQNARWAFDSSQRDLGVAASLSRLYQRHEGGLISRALGRAVHALLQELARLRVTQEWDPARSALAQCKPRVGAELRAVGVGPTQADQIAGEALELALKAANDPSGQWILSPHAEAASEACWTGAIDGALRSVRVDRVFRAGFTPHSEEGDCWWIIDYKTAHDDLPDPSKAIPRLRELFAAQLEAYAAVLRNLHGKDASIRAGLYYPRMALLDWWDI